eukprot:tig00000157_g9693.t1
MAAGAAAAAVAAAAAGPENEPYDARHLEQLWEMAAEFLGLDEGGWRAAVEHGDMTTFVRDPDVDLSRWGIHAPVKLFRNSFEVDAPLDCGERFFIAQSNAQNMNEFVVSETEVATLSPPQGGFGSILVHDNRASFFGWHVDTLMIFAPRRLPDGSAAALKLPVERGEDGVWSTRNHMRHMRSFSVRHVTSNGAGGFRCSILSLEGVPPFFSYIAPNVWWKLFARVLMKFMLQARRTLLSELAGAEPVVMARPRPFRSPLFASGSAAAPSGLGLGLFAAGLGPAPGPPSALHSWEPPDPPRPSSSSGVGISDLFRELVGIGRQEEPEARTTPESTSGSVPGEDSEPMSPAVPSQRLAPEVEGIAAPSVVSRVTEAIRASLDLAMRLECMSLSGGSSPTTYTREAAPLYPPAPCSPADAKARARRFSAEVEEEEQEQEQEQEDDGGPGVQARPRGPLLTDPLALPPRKKRQTRRRSRQEARQQRQLQPPPIRPIAPAVTLESAPAAVPESAPPGLVYYAMVPVAMAVAVPVPLAPAAAAPAGTAAGVFLQPSAPHGHVQGSFILPAAAAGGPVAPMPTSVLPPRQAK